MRGGEAGCVVKMETEGGKIANPTINEPDDFLILNGKFFKKYMRFSREGAGIYTAPESKDKNLNLMLLKEYVRETGFFSDEEIVEAIKTKFRREEIYQKKIEAYLSAEQKEQGC